MVNLLVMGLDKTHNRNITLQLLAKANSSMSHLPYNPMFGSWVQSYNHSATFKNTNFTLKEMRGLYGVLMNGAKLGPPRNEIVLKKCLTGDAPCDASCGFMICLGAYVEILQKHPPPPKNWTNELKNYLCPDSSSACFGAGDSPQQLGTLAIFVFQVLPAYVHWYMDSNEYGLVTNRAQSDLASGYVMRGLPYPPDYPAGIYVPGVLTNHTSQKNASENSKQKTFYTCKSTTGNKYEWAGERI